MSDWASDTEDRLLDAALSFAGEMGWSSAMLNRAARRIGLSRGETELLLPHGPKDLAALLSRRHDRRGMATLASVDPSSMKIRERISLGVEARLDGAFEDEAALRRWAGFLTLPMNLPLALRLAWESADGIWRWAGDVSTDENHYTKRTILAGILISTLSVRLYQGREAAMDELSSRINNVMAFEKWKASLKPAKALSDVAASLGRLRHR